MREIIFRGKREGVRDWVYGNLIECSNTALIGGGWDIQFNNERKLYEAYLEEIIPETVGQFTGLVDKNGVKVFEGDVVKITHGNTTAPKPYIRKVEIILSSFGQLDMFGSFSNGELNYPEVEVIGNIHDNPELLEGVDV